MAVGPLFKTIASFELVPCFSVMELAFLVYVWGQKARASMDVFDLSRCLHIIPYGYITVFNSRLSTVHLCLSFIPILMSAKGIAGINFGFASLCL
jgi:hypothetical protein